MVTELRELTNRDAGPIDISHLTSCMPQRD